MDNSVSPPSLGLSSSLPVWLWPPCKTSKCSQNRDRPLRLVKRFDACVAVRFTLSDCIPPQLSDPFKIMVLLIGNYSPDQQQSMQRFNALMLQGLLTAGIEAELIRPPVIFGKFKSLGSVVAKWLGYIDK